MRTHGLGTVGVVLLASTVVWCTASSARAAYVQQIPVQHINVGDYPDVPEQGAIASWMVLKYLGNGSDAHIATICSPGLAIYEYGRSLQETGAFHQDTVRDILNYFESDPDYEYAVVHSADSDVVVGQIVYWLNRSIPNVAPYPMYAPALIPFGGSYNRWNVVTGTLTDANPGEYPDTTVRGFWVDDPAIYNDPMNPIETNIFFSTDYPGSGALQTFFLPMSEGPYTGQYVAVIPVPEPGSLSGILVLAAFVARRPRTRA